MLKFLWLFWECYEFPPHSLPLNVGLTWRTTTMQTVRNAQGSTLFLRPELSCTKPYQGRLIFNSLLIYLAHTMEIRWISKYWNILVRQTCSLPLSLRKYLKSIMIMIFGIYIYLHGIEYIFAQFQQEIERKKIVSSDFLPKLYSVIIQRLKSPKSDKFYWKFQNEYGRNFGEWTDTVQTTCR